MEVTITPIKITDKTAKSGTPFFVVEDAAGQSYTGWESEIKLVLQQNLNTPVKLEVKESGEYKNIRAIYSAQNGTLQSASTNTPVPSINPTPVKAANPGPSVDQMRNKSIVAQCLTKCACELISQDFAANSPEIVSEAVVKVYQTILGKI